MNLLRRTRCYTAAFTLIELLVVVTIIAILASLLLPALAKAKTSGKKAVCSSNMKQMGVAVLLYVSDSESMFPIYSNSNRPTTHNSLYQNVRHYIWWGTTGIRLAVSATKPNAC